jgi:hypothetical protein
MTAKTTGLPGQLGGLVLGLAMVLLALASGANWLIVLAAAGLGIAVRGGIDRGRVSSPSSPIFVSAYVLLAVAAYLAVRAFFTSPASLVLQLAIAFGGGWIVMRSRRRRGRSEL